MKKTKNLIFLVLFFSNCIVLAQNYTSPANFSFTNTGNNSSFTTRFILVNSSINLISYLSTTASFSNVTTGTYRLYAVNFDPSGTAPTLTVGTNLNAIGGSCVALSAALVVTVISGCVDNPTLPNYTNGTTIVKAPTTISAINTIASGATVTYQAGNLINLNAGFKAESGSIFIVQIGGCNN
jgi:hypothetical protein